VRHLLDLGYVDAVHAFDRMVARSQGAAAVARDCVDHILFSRELEGYRAELLEGGGSDHPPVMGEVGRRGGGEGSQQRARGEGGVWARGQSSPLNSSGLYSPVRIFSFISVIILRVASSVWS